MYTNVYRKGNYLYVRGVEDGRRFSRKVDFRPTIWTEGKVKDATGKWHTLDGKIVYALQPGTMYDTKDYLQRYSDVHGMALYESPGHVYQWIAENYPEEIVWYPKDIQVFTLDIETQTEYGFPDPNTAGEQIILLTIKDTRHEKLITWGLGPFKNNLKHVEYRQFDTEQGLLKDFIVWWQQNYPDVVTGWNITMFDIPYLYNRMCRVLGETLANKLSPWGQVSPREINYGNRKVTVRDIAGIADLDYLDLYNKFTYTAQESYKLDHIAFVELGERKVENPGTTFKDFYTNHWQTFVEYNIRDVELVDKLDAKMKLMDLALTIAYAAKVNYEDVFSPVKTWDIIIYNYLNEQKIVVPPRKGGEKTEAYEGAFVKDPLVGKHNWCCSFDLNSLYPHLIMQYNMSPETITDLRLNVSVDSLLDRQCDLQEAYDNDYAVAANGWCFRRDKKGLLPTQMQLYYDKRVIYKKEMLKAKQEYENTNDPKWKMEISRLNNLQMAMKILLNSAYGACGNAYFRYFDTRIAEGITISGQLSIRWIANKLNGYLDKILDDKKDRIVLIDTDSVVLTLNDLVNKFFKGQSTDKTIRFMDKFAEDKIQPFLDKSYQELADYVNAYEQKMQMKRENLVDVMISVSKKRYVMSVHNSEGVQYKEPQLKVMGLQMVKSSTPNVIKEKLKDSLPIILHGQEQDVQLYVADYKTAFRNLDVESIAFPRGITDVQKYAGKDIYVKGTPIHVRGALMYNHLVKSMQLDKKYPLIKDKDKIKFVYLKTPNPIGEDCIAFVDKLPAEFNLTEYVDYNKMFEKTFQDAVQNILDALGWSVEQRATLEDWFA